MELCKYSTKNIRSLLKKAYESDCSIVANTPMINSLLGKKNHNRFNIYFNLKKAHYFLLMCLNIKCIS